MNSNQHENSESKKEYPAEETSGDEFFMRIDLKYIWILLKKRIIYIIATAVLMSLGAYYLRDHFTQRTWRGRCIIIKHEKRLSSDTDVPYLYQETNFNTLLETIKLRENLQMLIDEFDLHTTPEGLFNKIDVKRGNRSNILNVYATSPDAQISAKMANRISEIFIQSHNKILNSAADKIYQYYISQRVGAEKKIAEAEDAFVNLKNQYGLISIDEEMGFKLEKISDMELMVQESIMLKKEHTTRIVDLKERIKALPDMVKLTETVQLQEVQLKRELSFKLSDLRQKYTDENPKVIAVKAQLNLLNKNMGEETIKNYDERTYGENSYKKILLVNLTTFENELLAIEEKIKGYQDSINKFRSELGVMTTKQKDYYTAQNKVELARELLNIVEGRIIKAKMAKEANVGDLEILEYASIPKTSQPTRKKLIAIATFCGFSFLGVILIAASVLLDTTIKTEIDLKGIEGVDFLGVLPDRKKIDTQSFFSDLQVIVNKIDNNHLQIKPYLMAFLSLDSADGKSTLINEIAGLKSKNGKSVLVIEKNPPPEIAEQSIINKSLFGLQRDSAIVPIKSRDNLDKLYWEANSDICQMNLTEEQIRIFLSNLRGYDYILMEMFEIGINVQIASNIISVADNSVIVSKFKKTSRNELHKTISNILESNNSRVGVVINFFDPDFI